MPSIPDKQTESPQPCGKNLKISSQPSFSPPSSSSAQPFGFNTTRRCHVRPGRRAGEALRDQTDALKAATEDNRQQLAATNQLLKDAISKREATLFRTDEEIDKLNTDRMNALAEAIAKEGPAF